MNLSDKHKNMITVFLIVVLIILLIPRMNYFSVEAIVNFVPSSIPLAALVFLIIYCIKSIVVIMPAVALYIAAGIVFPRWWALLISFGCMAVALSIGYLNGKRLGEEKVRRILEKNKKIANFMDKRKDNLPSLCFISRVIPFPIDLISMFFGAVGMPYFKYIIVSLLGLSSKMIPFILASASISNPLSPEFITPFVFILVISIAVFIVFEKQNERREKNGA